jgi:hypothetical protein
VKRAYGQMNKRHEAEPECHPNISHHGV